MKTLGRHLIAELYGCADARLDDLQGVRNSMLRAAEIVGATVVGETFHRFAPQGVSGTVVIAESHLSIHTWPERGYVSIDIYTCGGLDPHLGLRHLAVAFAAQSTRTHEVVRGLPEDFVGEGPWSADDVQIINHIAEEKAAPQMRD